MESGWSKQNDEYRQSKTRSWQQTKTIKDVEEIFKNLRGISQKITEKPIPKITHSQLDIQQGQITKEKRNLVLTKIKSRKATNLDEILPKTWKRRKLDHLLLWSYLPDPSARAGYDTWSIF